jgi:vesicle coat complex subunit
MNCVGKLELIDRPAGLSLAAGAAEFVRFSVKVTSAEAGRVFGAITYHVAGAAVDQRLLPLATITLSPADYMAPTHIEQASVRKKLDEFEWERKQTVNTTADSLAAFIQKIHRRKNAERAGADLSLPFLTRNLTRSPFGEEVLANVNVELDGKKVRGFIRLRTDT